MASRPRFPLILEVIFESRDDGGLRAYCENVPGFVLSHSNAESVLADVEPALEVILTSMYATPVRVQLGHVPGCDNAAEMPAYLCGAAQYVGQSEAA